jgi:hypothetical protein
MTAGLFFFDQRRAASDLRRPVCMAARNRKPQRVIVREAVARDESQPKRLFRSDHRKPKLPRDSFEA